MKKFRFVLRTVSLGSSILKLFLNAHEIHTSNLFCQTAQTDVENRHNFFITTTITFILIVYPNVDVLILLAGSRTVDVILLLIGSRTVDVSILLVNFRVDGGFILLL